MPHSNTTAEAYVWAGTPPSAPALPAASHHIPTIQPPPRPPPSYAYQPPYGTDVGTDLPLSHYLEQGLATPAHRMMPMPPKPPSQNQNSSRRTIQTATRSTGSQDIKFPSPSAVSSSTWAHKLPLKPPSHHQNHVPVRQTASRSVGSMQKDNLPSTSTVSSSQKSQFETLTGNTISA